MRVITKGFIAWTVGIAVVLGSSEVSLALPKIRGGHTYCSCVCGDGIHRSANLYWEKVASCAVNGKACSFSDTLGGPLYPGSLRNCEQCTGVEGGGFDNCTVAMTSQPPGGIEPPAASGMVQPPGSPPPPRPGIHSPGMTSPIMPRGVEGGPGVEGEHGVEQVPAEEPSGK